MPTWLLIVLGQLIGLALYFFAPGFWIKKDVAEFVANGSLDSRHETFHRQRLTWRIGFDVVVALVCSLPWLLVAHQEPIKFDMFLISSGGLASIGAAWFFFHFNPGLSLARGLDYVSQYYVSFDPAASWWPDRWLANRAIKALPYHGEPDAVTDTNRRAYAARELQLLLRWVLVAGVAVYVVGVGTSCWLS